MERYRIEEFSRRLAEQMHKQRLSQSDLARKVWGTTTDARGYEVARNRDRISQYLKARAMPDTSNLVAIANALGCDSDDLAPPAGSAAEQANPAIQITTVAGTPDKVYLTVNALVPMATALKVGQLIADANK